MVWRKHFRAIPELMTSLLFFLGQTVTQEPSPVQCQPCQDSNQFVQCVGDVCPVHYQVTGKASSVGSCRLPSTTPPTTAASTVPGVPSGVTGDAEDRNSSTASGIPPVTTTITNPSLPTTGPQTPPSNSTPPSTPTPTTLPPTTTTCRICLEHCRTCNGSRADDCAQCHEDYQFDFTDSGVKKCVPTKENRGGINILIIAAAGGGGGALLLVVVVLLVCVCCRRCRRSNRDEEQHGAGITMTMDDLSAQREREKEEGNEEKEDGVQMRPQPKPGIEVPDYVNVASAMPRPVSIERGHDKVTRYVRDPTVKRHELEPSTPATEEQELANLPAAPLPPPGARKRSTDAGTPWAPTRSHTAPRPDTRDPDQTRRRPGPSATLPAFTSALSESDAFLPKFPIEEEAEQLAAERAASGGKAPKPTPATDEEELEDPEMDYENVTGSKAKLAKVEVAGDEGRSPEGIDNPGLAADIAVNDREEPEDEYVNQAAIREAIEDENPYQNLRGLR